MISMHQILSSQEVMVKMEKWIKEHMEDPRRCALGPRASQIPSLSIRVFCIDQAKSLPPLYLNKTRECLHMRMR